MTEIDIDWLIKVLPKLIRENDQVKGAILTALSGVVATREDIKDLIKEMDKRFEQVDKRFEQVDSQFQSLNNAVKDLALSINRMESKSGKTFEKTVLELMAETLRLTRVDPETIRSETLSDPDGIVFYAGYTTDVNVILENGSLYLVEIKATADSDDIAHFLQNIKLYEQRTKKAVTRPIIVCLRIQNAAKQLAEAQSIQVIAGSELD